MTRINYDKEMQRILNEHRGMRLLLHSCCAPCSSYCLEQVAPYLRTTVFYYNPNLDTAEEYARRKAEQIRLLRETGLADFLDCDYASEDYLRAVRGLEGEREGGARCTVCFALRLVRTAREAKARGYDFFGTTLTVSPLKDAARINMLGERIAEEMGVAFLYADFKKRGGYLRSTELSREHRLYRQNYCGCLFSRRD